MDAADGVGAAEALLAARKRRVYEVGILLVVGVIVANWFNRDPGEVVVTYVYPLTALLFLAMIPVLRRGRLSLHRIEVGLFAAGGAAVGIGLIDLLFLTGSLEVTLLSLTGAQYWAFALLLVFGFVVFDRTLAQRVAASMFLLSLALAAAAVATDPARGEAQVTVVLYLLRLHVFLGAILLVTMLVASLREQLYRAIERAELLDTRAMTDPLTGAANRFAAEERFAVEVADAARRSRPLAVVMIDIDHFKEINDAHGHDVGDAVLVAVTRTLETQVRPRDLVARWGGEEFLLLLPEADLAAARDIAERCRLAVEQARPDGIAVTATFGVAELVDDEPASGVVRRADVALYDGKHAGRNRVVSGDAPEAVR